MKFDSHLVGLARGWLGPCTAIPWLPLVQKQQNTSISTSYNIPWNGNSYGARFTKTVRAHIQHISFQIWVSRIFAGIVLQEFTTYFNS